MLMSELARLGDKIDITFLHQENGKVYKSSIFEFLENNILEICMPTDNGRMVLFNLGMQCDMFFYTQRGMYTCEGKVVSRYKKENFYLLAVKITSEPKRYQRREYYRVDCSLELTYYKADVTFAELEATEDVIAGISEALLQGSMECCEARTMDLSGGGMRFLTKEQLERDSYLVIVIRLTNDRVDNTFHLVARLIDCIPKENAPGYYVARVKFLFKDLQEREQIIRFVFEQDRMLRKKENGK